MDETQVQESDSVNAEILKEIQTAELCRLCLHYGDKASRVNIFEDKLQEGSNEVLPLDKVLNELFQINYEKTPGMPHVVCQRCLDMVKAFLRFRRIVQNSDAQLRSGSIDLKALKVCENDTSLRPGLNGNPGVFEAEEGCEIIEVNPEQDYASSDDDFSIETESDVDELNETRKPAAQAHTKLANENSAFAPQAAKGTLTGDNDISMSKTPEHPTCEFKNAYLCQYCDIAFTTHSDCAQHEAQHNANAPYMCYDCPLQYTNRANLIAHIRELHNPQKPYVCALCTKGFFRRCDLKKHSIVHTGLRPYSCRVCGKSFSRNTTLTKHMRIHSGSRPYVCQHCPRSFATAVELFHHGRLHAVSQSEQVENLLQQTNSLPRSGTSTTPLKSSTTQSRTSGHRLHACDICSKSFTRERDLHRHQALHLDTLFTCKQCGVGFNRREKLARHELLEHAAHYPCGKCHSTFLKSDELEAHLKMHQLQESLVLSAQQAVLGAASIVQTNTEIAQHSLILPQQTPAASQRASAADLSFYNNLVPTMNLGFYNETRPEDRNGR